MFNWTTETQLKEVHWQYAFMKVVGQNWVKILFFCYYRKHWNVCKNLLRFISILKNLKFIKHMHSSVVQEFWETLK